MRDVQAVRAVHTVAVDRLIKNPSESVFCEKYENHRKHAWESRSGVLWGSLAFAAVPCMADVAQESLVGKKNERSEEQRRMHVRYRI